MKRTVLLYAAAWGALLAVIVVLTNVVFPTPNESDSEYTGWYVVLYLSILLLFAIGGAIASERDHPLRSGALGGAVSALIILGMVMLTFAVIDNVFLDIVSQQIDKITAFHQQTTYASMRDFINAGLLMGTLFVLPVGAAAGGALGAGGSWVRRRFTPHGAPTASPV